MKIIFLDIDGVLNYLNYFIKSNDIRLNYNKYLKTNENNFFKKEKYLLINKIREIDIEKLYLLKEIINRTNSKVVITSSWRNLKLYPLIEEYLIKLGIPIIDKTKHLSSRGEEIKDYLNKHKIDNYIIIDDDIFPDYDEELLFHLIHTNFYNEGLDYDNKEDAVYKLNYR